MTSDEQLRQIVDYLSQGFSNGHTNSLGIELEHFVLDIETRRPVFYESRPGSDKPGVEGILTELAPAFDTSDYVTQPNGSQRLLGLDRPLAKITLEPGAQLEISLGPVQQLSKLETLYRAFRADIDPILDSYGYRLATFGYQPWALASEVPLIPRQRYLYMDHYFLDTGQHGICMMRGTASTQVSLDYVDEDDACSKLRIINALSPLLSFVTDNSPFFETLPVGFDGYSSLTPSGLMIPRRMVRSAIWQDVDHVRTILAPGSMQHGYSFADYAATILAAPAIYTIDPSAVPGKENIYQGSRSYAEVFAGQTLTTAEISLMLTLFYFDCRLRTYLEIRMADSMPIEYALAYTALLSGLFYSKENLAWLSIRLAAVTEDDILEAREAIRSKGWSAEVYGRPITDWLDALVFRATIASVEDRHYLAPLHRLIKSRTTLVEEFLAGRLGYYGEKTDPFPDSSAAIQAVSSNGENPVIFSAATPTILPVPDT